MQLVTLEADSYAAMCGTFPIAPCIHADPARAGVPGGRRIARRSGADSGTRDGGRIHPIVLRDGGGTRGLLRSDQRQPSLLLGIQWPGPAWRRHDDRPVNAGGGGRWTPFSTARRGFRRQLRRDHGSPGILLGRQPARRAGRRDHHFESQTGCGRRRAHIQRGEDQLQSHLRPELPRWPGILLGFQRRGPARQWHERQPPSQHSDSRTGQPQLQPDNDRRSTHLRCDHRPQGVLLGSQHLWTARRWYRRLAASDASSRSGWAFIWLGGRRRQLHLRDYNGSPCVLLGARPTGTAW